MHSTTSTSSYLLTKYSRSYPSSSDTQRTVDEWQHFTNPVIRLVLDTKVKSNKELESVRLRILWNMNSGIDDLIQDDVVFEDIELLSFSALASRNIAHNQSPQGLPLKAVYRDTIVGIKYQHPRERVANPQYRRFQVAFQTPQATLEFINSIKTVCPCKSNPQAPTVNSNISIAPSAVVTVPSASSTSSKYILPDRGSPLPYNSFQTAPSPALTSRHSVLPSGQASKPAILPSHSSVQPASQAPMNFSSSPPNICALGPSSEFPSSSPLANHWTVNNADPMSSGSNHSAEQTGQPEPSPTTEPSSSNDHQAKTFAPAGVDHLISSLRETTLLYNLSAEELEGLVAKVVREEGFPKLMENLSSLWRLKPLFGI